jgi:hypothetical protein
LTGYFHGDNTGSNPVGDAKEQTTYKQKATKQTWFWHGSISVWVILPFSGDVFVCVQGEYMAADIEIPPDLASELQAYSQHNWQQDDIERYEGQAFQNR